MALGNLRALVPRTLNIPSCHNLLIMPLIHTNIILHTNHLIGFFLQVAIQTPQLFIKLIDTIFVILIADSNTPHLG
jgi:hypothetical protein